jgi:hypothetical protein
MKMLSGTELLSLRQRLSACDLAEYICRKNRPTQFPAIAAMTDQPSPRRRRRFKAAWVFLIVLLSQPSLIVIVLVAILAAILKVCGAL